MQLRLLNHPNFKDTGGGGYGPLLFWLLAVFAIAGFWTTPRLPFVDLPQHAAQISMLRDMMQGRFLWGEIAQLDLWTCYLIGYVPSALLALILPVTTAIKVVLSLAAVALYWMCLNFRRYYQAPAILDYLFIPIVFGTTLQWGMITFFIAAPLGLCFILLADRYARTPTYKLGVGLLLLGALVMQAHILTFLFTGFIGGGLLLIHNPSISRLLRWCWPYLGFLGYVLIYMLGSKGDMEVTYGSRIVMDLMALRLWLLPRAPFDGDLREPYWWALFIPYFLPFIAGLRPGWKVAGAWVPIVFFLIVWMTSPSTFFGTYGVYARFSIFLLPFYVVIFREHLAIGAGQRRCAVLLMAAFAGMYTGIQHVRLIQAKRENAAFENILALMEPGQRALNLSISYDSKAFQQPMSYINWPLWYQAEKQGWVDFNFAIYHVQSVRFKSGMQAKAEEPMFGKAYLFNWDLHEGRIYRYFVIRALDARGEELAARLIGNKECEVKLIVDYPPYKLLERGKCVN